MLEALEDRVLPSFAAPVSYNIGTQPSPNYGNISSDGVATGDFRGNGTTDLAVVHSADQTLNILLGNGDGTFQPAVSYAAPGMNSGPFWVTVGDFAGNGKLDIAVLGNQINQTTQANEGVIDIFMGNGDGTFQPAVSYDAGPVSRGGIAVGDFFGDGNLDLAVADFAAVDSTHMAVDILRNNGNGTFQAPYAVPVLGPVRSVVAGDFNGDGQTDLAVAGGLGDNDVLDSNYPAGVTILLGNGDGTFTTAGQYNTPPTPGGGIVNPESITAGDLRNNGITDLVVSLYDHNIDVLLGNGDGTFQPAVGYNTWIDSNTKAGWYPRTVAIADVDGNGTQDLVVANIGTSPSANPSWYGSVAVLQGNGDGTFQAPTQYTPFNYPGSLAVADFNGDGLPDIAVSQVQDGHSVNIMLNQGESLTATGTTLQATAGQDLAAVVASFIDAGSNPGLATDYSAVIDWGDGTLLSTGGISVLGNGNYEVAASHPYAAAGAYTITVTITDTRTTDRTATALSTSTVTASAARHSGYGLMGPWWAPSRRVAPTMPAILPIPSW